MIEPIDKIASTQDPEWLQVLRSHCETQGQTSVAQLINYSATTISLVLSGKYPGKTERIAQAVEGSLMRLTRECPALGPIPADSCLEAQRRTRERCGGNHVFLALYRACRDGCPHFLRRKEPHHE